jgi:hypothetical protein
MVFDRVAMGGISLLVYGRNDGYGYNLHKRAVISLNCMAEQLDPGVDEMLFVDCNSPNDVPTFPEAIADTLTKRAKTLLRVFRIRPEQFRRFAKSNSTPVQEALSRNVGILRSSTSSRWILSTNTDNILLSRSRRRLTDIVSGLSDGYYGLPRFSLPQALWETLQRSQPEACMEQVREWADAFGLRLILESKHPFLRYANPGDFQLFLRKDIFRIGGFNEDMVKGPLHLDSNLAKRLSLLYGPIRSLNEFIDLFHCDHNRQESLRQQNRLYEENDWSIYVEDLNDPCLLHQQPGMGAKDCSIEEIRLNDTATFATGLASVLPSMVQPEAKVFYPGISAALFPQLPYLADHLITLPPGALVGVLGCNPDLPIAIDRLLRFWVPGGSVLSLANHDGFPNQNIVSLDEMSNAAHMLVFDPGTRNGLNDIKLMEKIVVDMASLQSKLAFENRAKTVFMMGYNSWIGGFALNCYHLQPDILGICHGRSRDLSEIRKNLFQLRIIRFGWFLRGVASKINLNR